jgi:hypothetical protein
MKFKSTLYLYGIEPMEFEDMRYRDALEYRIAKAKELIGELQEVTFRERDDNRIRNCLKAIQHNEMLLGEIS